jgi:hypothetical protein
MSDTSGCPENAQASLTAAMCSRKKILAKSGKITAGETQTSPLSNEGNDPQRSERNIDGAKPIARSASFQTRA